MRYSFIILTIFFSVFQNKNLISQTFYRNYSVEGNVDNDILKIFGKRTDRYYTNGFNVILHYNQNAKVESFGDKFLFSFRNDTTKRYTWGISQKIFTSSDIHAEVQKAYDFPFSGSLYATHSVTSENSAHNVQLTSEISIGVLGPLSLAAETQRLYHTVIGIRKPLGWEKQIQNSIILNYNLQLHRKLISRKYFCLKTDFDGDAGSLLNKCSAGLHLDFGILNNNHEDSYHKNSIFFTFSSKENWVLYNAYLQGGLFESKTTTNIETKQAYSLLANEIHNFYSENSAGIHYSNRLMAIAYTQTFWSAFSKHTENHSFGSINLVINY